MDTISVGEWWGLVRRTWPGTDYSWEDATEDHRRWKGVFADLIEDASATSTEAAQLRHNACPGGHRVNDARDRAFVGCLCPERCDPRSHGNITRIETCGHCGAERPTNINSSTEQGVWA